MAGARLRRRANPASQSGCPQSSPSRTSTSVLTPELTFGPLGNSVLLSGGAALLTVVLGLLAAYPLSRYRMRITKPFLYGILFGTCLPITAMMVPVYSRCSCSST